MKFTVEAIEDNVARLECDGNGPDFVPLERLPSYIKEGDILFFDGENYNVDSDATAARKKSVYKKFDKLFGKE